MSEDLNKLRELAEAATPGPWFQSGSPWFQTGGFVLAGSPDPHAGTVLADLSDTWEMQQADDALDADHERDPDKDAAFIAAFNPATALSLLSRLQAAEERAEKLEEAMLNVQQQCENVVFNLSQRPYHPLANSDAVRIFGRMAKTLRLAALKTEGA